MTIRKDEGSDFSPRVEVNLRALRRLAIENAGRCRLCSAEWSGDDGERHEQKCLLATPEPIAPFSPWFRGGVE